jgi:hypothetical protein
VRARCQLSMLIDASFGVKLSVTRQSGALTPPIVFCAFLQLTYIIPDAPGAPTFAPLTFQPLPPPTPPTAGQPASTPTPPAPSNTLAQNTQMRAQSSAHKGLVRDCFLRMRMM